MASLSATPILTARVTRCGLVIAQDSGNRLNATYLAQVLARLEAEHGDPLAALDYTALAIRNHHDSGNTIQVRDALAVLAGLFDHLGRYEAAATIAGFAFNPMTAAWHAELDTAIAHLRDLVGGQTYEALARKGETMSSAEMLAYAYAQIDEARAQLKAVAK